MTIQSLFAPTDTLLVTRLALDYSDDLGRVQASSLEINGFCAAKSPNDLRIRINVGLITQLVGFDLDVNVTFVGQWVDASTVRWTADQVIDAYIAEFDATVDRFRGAFTTRVSEVSPPESRKGCDGLVRQYRTELATIGDGNGFDLFVHGNVFGIGVNDFVRVKNFVFHATGGVYSVLRATVRAKQNHCHSSMTEGAKAQFAALVTGASGFPLAYQWSVQGATTLAVTAATLDVQLPALAAPVTIGLLVTDANGLQAASTLNVRVLTAQEAAFRDAVCRLLEETRRAWLRRPTFDPRDPLRAGQLIPERDRQRYDELAQTLIKIGQGFRRTITGAK
ncbi:MAG: hypothetical protein IT355_20845 [Gemmatimonadaceae bacterium]|nr:hypothetical protein [Gemmatimonadaceae bacterium]